MTPEQVFGKLNKDIKGLTSGVASASVSGSSIIFTMNDGSTQTITFPQPKDGASIVAVSTNENNQFVFSMSDGTEIVGGEVPASYGVSKEYVDSELSKKANNSDIPTKVSGLQNDSNYQTDTDVATALTPYAKSADVTKEITNKVAEIVADAPEDFNTLKEMSDWISNHENDASAMNSAISDNKTSITALQTGKADKSEIPTALPANGGNADTVNGHTVGIDVPSDAKFTDTTYSDATQIEHGLMSVDDKKKLDGLKKYTPDGTTITADEDGTLHGVKVTVDTALSPTSTNPVQNKAVKAYVDKKVSENVDFSTSTSKTLNDTVEAPLVIGKATRNLLNPSLLSIAENDLKDSGITAKINSDGSITLNGIATRSIWSVLYTTYGSGKNNMFKGLRVFSNLNYNESGVYGELYIAYCRNNNGTKEIWRSGHDGDLIPDGNGEPCWVRLHITSGATFNNETFFIMLTDDEEGAVNDKLIPYSGYDIKTCGKNLLNLTKIANNNTGATASLSNGIITLDRTVDTSGGWQDLYFNTDEQYISLKRGVKYTISTKDKVQKVFLMLRRHNGLEIVYSHDCSTNGTTFVASEDMVCQVTITFKESSTFNNTQIAPQIEVGEKATEYEPYKDGGTVHIDSSTEFPLLGLKSFDGETNIISPGNVEVTYAKSDSGKAILDMSENKLDKGKVADVNWTSVDISSVDENTNAGATINYCIKNGICYMSILNIGFKTANQAIILGDNSIPKPSSDYCWCPLVCVADPSYSVLIHPNLSGGLEHRVVGLTNQVYSGLFSYPVAES